MSLVNKTIYGVIWHFTQLLVRRSINLIVMLILARILMPKDFGLIAMMAVFLAIGSSLMNSGFKQALIRMENATQVDFNTAFYSNLILGVVAYGVLFFVSPVIAEFYNEPKLIQLIRFAALEILINSFQVVQTAQLNRNINFKTELKVIVPASIVSGLLAVCLAYSGYGVWVLVIQSLSFAFINTLFLWLRQGWRPSLSFSLESFLAMYDFGYKIFLTGLINVVFRNFYIVVVSKFFSASVSGHYFFAEKVKDMVINQLISSIQTVTYSTLSNIHEDDELKAGYRKIISVVTFVLFPVMTILAGLAVPIFHVIMPEKWLPAATYLQLLCLSGLMESVLYINSNLVKIKGRSDLNLWLEILKKILVVSVFLFSFKYGIYGILIGQIVTSFLVFIPASYLSSKLVNYTIKDQVSDFIANLFLSSFIGFGVFFGVSFFAYDLLGLLVFALLSPILYLLIAYILRVESLILIIDIIRKRTKKRGPSLGIVSS